MNTELVLAWRNLWRRKKRTWITVAAMVFCNAILVFGITTQAGTYSSMIDLSVRLFSGHLQITAQGYLDDPNIRKTVPDGRALAARLRERFPEFKVVARSESFVLAATDARSQGVQIVGIEPDFEHDFSSIAQSIAPEDLPREQNAIALGQRLAKLLKVDLRDEISFLGSGVDGSFAAGFVQVSAVFETGVVDVDRALSLVPIDAFDEAFSMGGGVHQILILVPDNQQVASYKRDIVNFLDDPSLEVKDWKAIQPGLEEGIAVDMASASVMYGVLIIMVIFSVLNTQLMSVLERTREFGVMKAIGLNNVQLSKLLFLETFLLSSMGLVLGCIAGAIIAAYFAQAGIYMQGMEQANYGFQIPDRIYPKLTFGSVILGPAIVFVGSLSAAIYPSRRLCKLEPIAAMRTV